MARKPKTPSGASQPSAVQACAPPSSGQRLPRRERLRGHTRMDELFASGQTGKTRVLVARALPSPVPLVRVAFLAGKAMGNAVVRNRIRRRLRACYRGQKDAIKAASGAGGAPGWDIALVPRRGAAEAAFPSLRHELRAAIMRAFGKGPSAPP